MSATNVPSADDLHAAIERLALAIRDDLPTQGPVVLLGIANGGIELARRLGKRLDLKAGALDISFHRDDIGRNPIPKETLPSFLPLDIDGAHVILVDDVLQSGRTIKAALDELFDHGRPSIVKLAILVDRGDRRLPVAADYTGLKLTVKPAAKVAVTLDSDDPSRDRVKIA